MKFEKKGLIFNPKDKITWAAHTALQPTPFRLNDNIIRVFVGCRDNQGVSRIGYVDVSASDPSQVLGFSEKPILDIGLPGTFDDNGVVPSAICERKDGIYLYYAGYQLVKNVRFLVLCGLAKSVDNGLTFERIENVPILERTNEEFLFRVIHTIIFDNNKWKVWYGGGNHFIDYGNKTLPVYDIRFMESDDGISFPSSGKIVISNREDEHRVGRPCVIKRYNKYLMFFGASTPSTPYRLAYAESEDGIHWNRNDDFQNIIYKSGDFDSEMSAYPGVIEVNDRLIMFYNGNDYGKEGIGYAELIEN